MPLSVRPVALFLTTPFVLSEMGRRSGNHTDARLIQIRHTGGHSDDRYARLVPPAARRFAPGPAIGATLAVPTVEPVVLTPSPPHDTVARGGLGRRELLAAVIRVSRHDGRTGLEGHVLPAQRERLTRRSRLRVRADEAHGPYGGRRRSHLGA